VPKVDSALDCPFIQSTVNFGYTIFKEQSKMDNPEHCQHWTHEIEGAFKKRQYTNKDK
jgi:hypothetical protein